MNQERLWACRHFNSKMKINPLWQQGARGGAAERCMKGCREAVVGNIASSATANVKMSRDAFSI